MAAATAVLTIQERRRQGMFQSMRERMMNGQVLPVKSGDREGFEWSRSMTLPLAMHRCTWCHGVGLRLGRTGVTEPCNCALRAIFRICYAKYLELGEHEGSLSRISFDVHHGGRRGGHGLKIEEYRADFELIARRTLDEVHHRLFRLHFVERLDWRHCAPRLGLDHGQFFHAVYRAQQKLGRAFRETRPYGLFPLAEYFQCASLGPIKQRICQQRGRLSH